MTTGKHIEEYMKDKRVKKAALEARVQATYDAVPVHVREDIVEAALWARDTLMRKEGEGHDIQLSAEPDCTMVCSFAKPSWGGDHCGRKMDTASEAIVMAVCEYLEGM